MKKPEYAEKNDYTLKKKGKKNTKGNRRPKRSWNPLELMIG